MAALHGVSRFNCRTAAITPARAPVPHTRRRCAPRLVSATESPTTTDALVDVLTHAAKKPGSVPTAELLKAVVGIEKAKAPLPEDWYKAIAMPDKRWRLIYTAADKDVQACLKGQQGGSGTYFPLTACQKFEDDVFENGVFLGPIASLTFKGPCTAKGKQLSFDVHTMCLGVGPYRLEIPLKKDGKPLTSLERKEVSKLPFFLYAYVDNSIIVARGRSGGLALWAAADTKWQATAGVLQVFK